MVIGAFPAAKLGVLAIKQISKPIANVIKVKAKEHPLFRNYICMPPAQLFNWIEVKTKMWALNLGQTVHVPPLTEAMAVELGANLLGEFIIFGIGAAVLIYEYSRQTTNEAKKIEKARLERDELGNRLADMAFRLEAQEAQIREMTRVLADIESRSIFRWTKDIIQEMQQFNSNNPDQSLHRDTNKKESSYSPEGGAVMKALHFLETQVFTNERVQTVSQTPEEQTVAPEIPQQAMTDSEDEGLGDVVEQPSIEKPTLKQ